LPFLEYFKTQTAIHEIDDFAVANVKILFKKTIMDSIFSTISSSTNEEPWKECAKSYTLQELTNDCRISPGFDKNFVPKTFKYNTSKAKGSDEYKQAEYSYAYLKYCDDIEVVKTTPMSDFATRGTDDVLNKYRLIDYLKNKNIEPYKSYDWVDSLIAAYKEKDIKNIVKIFDTNNITESKACEVLTLHFDGDLDGNYSADFLTKLAKYQNERKPKIESSPIPIKRSNTALNLSALNVGGKLSKKKARKSRKNTKKSKKSKRKTRSKRQR
jgi:hypothetical protein